MKNAIEPYTLSIAIITRNRPRSLNRELKSIRNQDAQPMEILIGDDSDPEMAVENRRLAAEYDCRYLPPASPRGVYRNRNRLARACRGTHMRTQDDDHEYPPGHLDKCMQAIKVDPDAVWFAAEHCDGVPDPYRPPYCPGQLNARGFAELPPDPQMCWSISDGATIFPMSIFHENIFFYEQFTYGSSFMEFGSRLAWLGYRIRLLEDTYVIHHNGESHRNRDSIWYGSSQTSLSSRLHAALCHSFIYKRSARNKIITCLEITKEIILRRGLALRSLRDAMRSYRETKSILKIHV